MVNLNKRIKQLEVGLSMTAQAIDSVIIYDPVLPGDADVKCAEAHAMGIDTVILLPDNGRSRNEQGQAGDLIGRILKGDDNGNNEPY